MHFCWVFHSYLALSYNLRNTLSWNASFLWYLFKLCGIWSCWFTSIWTIRIISSVKRAFSFLDIQSGCRNRALLEIITIIFAYFHLYRISVHYDWIRMACLCLMPCNWKKWAMSNWVRISQRSKPLSANACAYNVLILEVIAQPRFVFFKLSRWSAHYLIVDGYSHTESIWCVITHFWVAICVDNGYTHCLRTSQMHTGWTIVHPLLPHFLLLALNAKQCQRYNDCTMVNVFLLLYSMLRWDQYKNWYKTSAHGWSVNSSL